MKMVWRISAQHKKLQSRMDQMRKFRRQHEQLRTVIVRVLRPTVRENVVPAEGEDMEPPKPAFSLDAADANAIEVNYFEDRLKGTWNERKELLLCKITFFFNIVTCHLYTFGPAIIQGFCALIKVRVVFKIGMHSSVKIVC